MKSAERYELLKKALSEGKNLTQAAKEQGVTPALLSQVKKKHEAISVVPQSVNQEAAASTAEA